MTIVTDLIEDLKTELEVLNRYSELTEVSSSKIKPLWWTDKCDGRYLAGFCEYNKEIFRFQIIYSDLSSDIHLYILQRPTPDQLKIELARVTDWESMVGFSRTFIGENGSWVIKDTKSNTNGYNLFYTKYLDDKRELFKDPVEYTENKAEFIFEL